jgi:N-acetylneuraminate lyase
MPVMKIRKYEGLVAAPFTPMDKNGNLNTGMIPEYYDFLQKNGIIGAFINGSTGEGPSLTLKEKQLQAVKWADCLKAGGKVNIINLVGGTSYQECIENAIFSQETGLSAIAILAPYYFKPADETSLAEFIARVGESVHDMPVYFYHMPALTGVNMPMIGFLKKISGMLPNFAGIKYTQEDFMDFFSCLSFENGKYDLLWGRDECILSAIVLGCKGAVGSTYNYAAPLYLAMMEAFSKGDHDKARKLQLLSIDIVSLLGKYGGIATGKAFMKYVGLDCGKFRSPVKNMTDGTYADFANDVRQLKIDQWFSRKL